MENQLISASKAKEFVDAGKAEKDVNNLAEVTKKINAAVQRGEYSCSGGEVTEATKRTLAQNGYEVKYMQPDPRDPGDRGYYQIKWG